MRARVVIPGSASSRPSVVNVPAREVFHGAVGRFAAGVRIAFLLFGIGILPILFMPFLLPLLAVAVLLAPFVAVFALKGFYDIECPYCTKMTRAALGETANSCGYCKQPIVFEEVYSHDA